GLEPGELARVGETPGVKGEDAGAEIDAANLGRVHFVETAIRALGPEADAAARACPPGPARPLGGRRPADPAELEPVEPARRISATPGRKTRISPRSPAPVWVRTSSTAAAIASGAAGRTAGRYSIATGNARPSTSTTGQPPRNRATGAASRVADMTTRNRS